MKDKLITLFKSDKCPVFFSHPDNIESLAEYICNNLSTNSWVFCGDKCVDRMPKNCNQVLVTRYNSKLQYSSVMIDSYNGYGEWDEDRNYNQDIWTVMAWQPLPNPII